MSTISVLEVEQDPRGFLDRVEAGEPLLLVKDDIPVAQITPVLVAGGEPRPYGLCAGQFTVPDDFDHALPENLLNEFEGR